MTDSLNSGQPFADFSDADVAALLRRTVRRTAIAGVVIALGLWLWMGWQTAALFAVGAAMSVGSIYEWGRLIRVVTARMDGAGSGVGSGVGLNTGVVVAFFLLRLMIFAGAIYVSLRCFHGSPMALLGGLGLAVAGLVWEAIRVLRG